MRGIWVSVPAGCLLLAAAGSGAMAFQEQKTPQATTTQPTAQVASPEVRKDEKGPVIKVPGFGRIGELPKLDFGLDLLYGASPEEREQKRRIDPNNKDDDLTVKGSIKYRY